VVLVDIAELLAAAKHAQLPECQRCERRGAPGFGVPCAKHFATGAAPAMFVLRDPGSAEGGAVATQRLCVYCNSDRTAINGRRFLDAHQIDSTKIYPTNAVLHAGYTKATPSRAAIAACARVLQRQIDLVDPTVIVAIGQHGALGVIQALGAPSALRALWTSQRGQPIQYGGRTIFATYHWSPLALNPNRAEAEAHWQQLAKLLPRRAA
jgi:uracil-DNA glycosylase family 4